MRAYQLGAILASAMTAFTAGANAQQQKNPLLDIFGGAMRQLEQTPQNSPPDPPQVQPAQAPSPKPFSAQEAWANLTPDLRECLRRNNIDQALYIRREIGPQEPGDRGLKRAWDTCNKSLALVDANKSSSDTKFPPQQIAAFRERLDALPLDASSLDEANKLAREIDEARTASIKNRVDITELDSLFSVISSKRRQIMDLAKAKAAETTNQQARKQDEEKKAAEQQRKLAAQDLVKQIEQRAASAKRWTTASRPNDGSIFLWRDLAIGDPQNMVLAKEEIGTCGPSGTAPDVETCTLLISYTQKDSLQTLLFKGSKLAGFQFLFDAKNAADNYKLLVERYGQPHQREQLTFQTVGGAQFNSLRATWNTPHGPMVFDERHERADVSAIEMAGVLRQSAPKPF